MKSKHAVAAALMAAILFGLSTPAAKVLLTVADPWLTAGLLYLGSGIGLGAVRVLQRLRTSRSREAFFHGADWPWLLGATVSGGWVGPVLCPGPHQDLRHRHVRPAALRADRREERRGLLTGRFPRHGVRRGVMRLP